LALAEKVDAKAELDRTEKELYNELTMTFARNVIPRTLEHGGDPDNQTPIPILTSMNVPIDNGNQKNIPTLQPDSSSTGGYISK
jgi:hypothetical protein